MIRHFGSLTLLSIGFALVLAAPALGRSGWSPGGDLIAGVDSGNAFALADGRVLIAGGECGGGTPCAAAELFEPLTGRWKSTHDMSAPREYFAAVRLQDGTVLVAGGLSYFGTLWRSLESAERFDPARGKFVKAKPMAHQRACFSMTMLPGSRVMAVGGDAWLDEIPGDAEIYTPR